jgi:hypothetical protein
MSFGRKKGVANPLAILIHHFDRFERARLRVWTCPWTGPEVLRTRRGERRTMDRCQGGEPARL